MAAETQTAGFRISPQQQSAWRTSYNSGLASCTIRVTGALDCGRLNEAFGSLVRKCEILRTVFTSLPGLSFPMQFVSDVRSIDMGVRVESGSHVLSFSTSNLQADRATFRLITEELARSYAGVMPEDGTPLQYADYAEWASEQFGSASVPGSSGLQGPIGWTTRHLAVNASPDDLLVAWALVSAEEMRSGLPVSVAVAFSGRECAPFASLLGCVERWIELDCRTADRSLTAFRTAMDKQLRYWREHQQQDPSCQMFTAPVAFAFECRERVEAGGLTWELISFRRECEAFPLKLTVVSSGGGVWGELEYDRGRWSEAEAQLLLQRYEAFVRGGMKPGAGFWELGDRGRDLGAEFELQAAARAGQAALRCGGREWTYAELGRRARQVAGALRRSGAGAESRVGLWADRSMETVAGLLGIWGAGAAAVLLEPGGPASRLAEQQSVAGVRWLLGKGERGLDGAERICLDEQSRVWEQEPAGALGGCLAEQLAYVIFTSGSTGRAKGVCLTHGALSAYAESMRERLGAEAGAVWESVSTLAADLGYTSVLGALLGGGTLVVRTEEESVDWHKVGGSDYLKITPGHLEALLAGGPEAGRVLPRKGLLLGGEDWGWELWERVKELSPGLRVYNHYGPTETAVGVLMGEAKLREGGHPVLGEPLGHVRAYILDQRGEPAGECGELWIGGRSVARGYQGAASATAERFRPDPWSAEAGQRVYGTGDRVRRQADGRYEYLGRMDSQIKIRGTRVELGEVEAALRRHPAVAQAAVVAMPAGPRGQPQLAAWVVPDNARAGAIMRLLQLDQAALPDGCSPAELASGITVLQENPTMTAFLHREIFDERCYLSHGVQLPEDAIVVDVGANIGLFTIQVSLEFPAAQVYALEPVPSTFAILDLNLKLLAPQARAERIGLGAKCSSAIFTHYPDFSGASGLHADPERDAASMRMLAAPANAIAGDEEFVAHALAGRWRSERVLCRLDTVSNFITAHSLPRIDLLKIDAERNEIEILQGIRGEDWERIRQIVLEAHDEPLREAAVEIMAAHGFHVEVDQSSAYRGSGTYNVYAISRRTPKMPTASPASPQFVSVRRAEEAIAEYLKLYLPELMLPHSINFLARMPLLPNGKLDRAALIARPSKILPGTKYREPATAIERVISQVWAEVLGRRRIGSEDNFFVLGGHSLLAIQCLSRLRAIFPMDLPLRVIFDAPRVSALAAAIEELELVPGQAARAAGLMIEIENMTADEVDLAIEEESS